MKICVFGAASSHIDDRYIKAAEELGEKMAKRGHSLVFGAGSTGMMGAVARGVKRGGGYAHGVMPKFFKDDGVEIPNENCNEIIYTESMSDRKKQMEDMADAFIILPGGIGTIEEFFEVFTLLQVGRHSRAIAIYNIGGYYDKLKEFLLECSDKKFITRQCVEICAYLNQADEILDYLENFDSAKVVWKDLLYGF